MTTADLVARLEELDANVRAAQTPNDDVAARMALSSWLANNALPLVRELREELDENDLLRSQLADILTRTANALRGEPAPLSAHSWHDLPERVERQRAELAEAKRDAERYRYLRTQHETVDDDAHQCGDSSNEWFVTHGYEPVSCVAGSLDEAIDAALAQSQPKDGEKA